jgi:hypothetical protein
MLGMRSQPIHRQFCFLTAIIAGAVSFASPVSAYTPESKEVKERVTRALGFLATAKDDRLGGECLIGLCFKKSGVDDHPKIAHAVDRCYKAGFNTTDNYSLGIALMFLCEADPKAHREIIDKYLAELLRRQKGHGGWGYETFQTGDTSQTQYGVLGIWMAKNFAEIDIPVEKMEGVMGWLMRTQDPSGGYGYQGIDSPGGGRVAQNGVTPTLSAAGVGSAYIMADMLQVTKRVDVPNAPRSKALQQVAVAGKKDPRAPLTVRLSPEDIKNTLASGDRALGTNYAPVDKWNHYYMYALERYHSFREKAGGTPDNKWYDSGFAHLAKTQNGSGSWEGEDNNVIATCLATLFLMRSSQKAIQKKLKMGDGVLKGGMNLPPDVRSIREDGKGQIVDDGVVVPTEQILELLEKGANPELDRLAEDSDPLKLSENASERKSQIELLRKKVSAADYESRKIAINTLSRDRNLENVPQLLYALTDPDVRIVLQADKGLRFISRKARGVGLPEGEPSQAQIKSAQAAWKAWYFSIRPDAELLD